MLIVEVDHVDSEALQARLAGFENYPGRPLTPFDSPGRCVCPNFVATMTLSRLPFSALPSTCSLWPQPYMSEESKWSTPSRSRAGSGPPRPHRRPRRNAGERHTAKPDRGDGQAALAEHAVFKL